MTDRLSRLRALASPADDRLARLRALAEPEEPAWKAKPVTVDAARVARPADDRTVAEHLGPTRFPWAGTEVEPEPEAERPRPIASDATRVALRPRQPVVLPQNTLTAVNPAMGRDQATRDLERVSYATPGPVTGAVERGLNVASGGLGRMVGGRLSSAITSRVTGQDAEALDAARANRAQNFETAHPTAARVGDVGGFVAGMGGEMLVARGAGSVARRVGARLRRPAETSADDLARFDDAFRNPEVRTIQRGDVADEVVGGDASFDFGAPPPRTTPAAAVVDDVAASAELPPLDPAVAKRYAKRSDDDLLAYYDELAERQGREGFVAEAERKSWTRETDDGFTLTGSTISNRGGRAIGAADTGARVGENVEAVLRHRGISDDVLRERFAEAQSRGFQGEAAKVPKPRIYGEGSGKGIGSRRSVYLGRSGLVGAEGEGAVPIMSSLTGGIGGAAAGATQGETPEERLRNAILGGAAGAVGGYAVGRGAERIGATRAPAAVSRDLPPLSTRGALGTAPIPDPTIGPKPDVSKFANLGKFALDPTGEARLADEVARVVQDEGLDPKRVVTWDETRAMAQSIGLRAADLSAGGKRLTGPEMLAVRNLVGTNIDQMTSLTGQLADATLPIAQREALSAEMRSLDAQNASLLNAFVRARTQTGRDLNNLRILANRVNDETFWLTKALDLAGPERFTDEVRATVLAKVRAREPEELVGYLATLRTSTRSDKALTFWKANLLTNPLTHVVNLTGNTTFAALEAVKDAPAAFADRLLSLATKQRTVSRPTLAIVKASVVGARQGIHEARQVMRGVPLDEVLKRWDIPREVNFDNVILDTYTKTVFRALGAGDRVFRGAALRGSLTNQATILARAEGARGKALRSRIAELASAPTDEMVLRAVADAEQATFTDATAIGKALRGFAREVPGGGFVVPFTRTPGAIATRTMEYSPFGLVKGAAEATGLVYRAVKGKAVPAEVQRQVARLLGRGTIGTGAVTAGYLMAQHGVATGMTDKGDRTQRETNQLIGRPDAALKVGNTWYEFGRLAPLGNLLALGATLYEVAQMAGTGEAVASMAGAGARTIIDQPFLTGPRQFLDAIEDPARSGRIATNLAAGFVPASAAFAAVARGTDPEYRQPTDMADVFQARIPGLSRKVAPAVDQFGQPAKREGGILDALFNPMRRTRDRTASDPLLAEMARLGVTVGRRGASAGRTKAQAAQLAATEGPGLRAALEDLVQQEGYRQASDEERADVVLRIVSRIRGRTGRIDRLQRLAEGNP